MVLTLIEIPRGLELRGAAVGAVFALLASAPRWVVLLALPTFSFSFFELAEELSGGRLPVFFVTQVVAFAATAEAIR